MRRSNNGRSLLWTALLVFTASCCGAAELQPAGISPLWKKRDSGGFECRYDGTGYPAVTYRAPLRKSAFYRLTFTLEVPVGGSFEAELKLGEKREVLIYSGREVAMNCVEYLFTGDSEWLELRFYPKPQGKSGVFILDRIRLEALPEISPAANLLPNADFEENDGLAFWHANNGREEDFAAGLAPSPDFPTGKTGMAIGFRDSGNRARIASRYLPLVPGKAAILRFWAKADNDTTITAVINTSSRSGHRGKHLYLTRKFSVGGDEWRLYELKFIPGDDFAAVPDLKEQLAKIQFFPPETGTGTIWIDNVEFRIAEAE